MPDKDINTLPDYMKDYKIKKKIDRRSSVTARRALGSNVDRRPVKGRASNPAQGLKNAAKKRLVSSLTAGHRANAGKKQPQPETTGSRLRGRQDSLNDALDMLNKQNRGK